VLRFIREREDRAKMREKFWELSGTKLGNLLKMNKDIDRKDEVEVKPVEGEDFDYKAESQYA
jgi:pre-mRNA-splicing factor ATP-dependent RNA helicase DHX38/PRP16